MSDERLVRMIEENDMTAEETETARQVMELVDLERDGARGIVKIGPYTMYTMIGMLELVLRHPNIQDSPAMVHVASNLRDQFAEFFRDRPHLYDVIQAGKDPANDVPQESKV